jgi:hypothetical protein
MPEINWWAVPVGAFASMMFGGLWYGKLLFGPTWARAAGYTEEEIAGKCKDGKHSHPGKVFATAYLASAVGALALALLLGPKPEWHHAVHGGFLAGAGVAATSFGINYAFAGRTFKLWAIDAGYHFVQFTIYGVILALWQ